MPKSAGEFIYNIRQAIEGKGIKDKRIADFSIMEKLKWSQRDLDETPAYKVAAYRLIMTEIAKSQHK